MFHRRNERGDLVPKADLDRAGDNQPATTVSSILKLSMAAH
jgi:hypothetical protein